MSTIFLIILLFINGITFTSIKEIIGIVVNDKGEPISDVNIYSGTIDPIKTNQNGEFRISIYPNKKNIIYFIKQNYKPIIKIIDYDNESDKFKIQMVGNDDRIIEVCQNKVAGKNLNKTVDIFRGNLQLVVSKKLDCFIKRGNIFSSYTIFYNNDKNTILSGSSGPGVTNGFPMDNWILDSTEIKIESFIYKNNNGNDEIGVDLKGKLQNGKYWRYVDNFKDILAEYNNVNLNESLFFDEIIDGLCSKK